MFTEYSLHVLAAYPVLPSQAAKFTLLSACQDMIQWIDRFLPLFESYVRRLHIITKEFEDSGIVTLYLRPLPRSLLSRRLALRGFETFKALVERYGEAEIIFELWEADEVKGLGRSHIRS